MACYAQLVLILLTYSLRVHWSGCPFLLRMEHLRAILHVVQRWALVGCVFKLLLLMELLVQSVRLDFRVFLVILVAVAIRTANFATLLKCFILVLGVVLKLLGSIFLALPLVMSMPLLWAFWADAWLGGPTCFDLSLCWERLRLICPLKFISWFELWVGNRLFATSYVAAWHCLS